MVFFEYFNNNIISSWRMSMKRINGYIIHLKECLGRGSFGEVCKGQQQGTKKIVAVKILTKKLINSDEYLKNALLQQIQILQQVKSRNIVGVYDVMQSSNNYYIIQQLCDSDLQKYMTVNHKVPEKRCIEILTQVVNGFVALIREGIIHRDIKPANILIKDGEMKIGDFGFAKKNVTKKMKSQTAVGTPLYMSLQLLKGEPYSSKCDIWAVGFIFYELLHNKTPWTAGTAYELIKNIQNKPLIIDSNLELDTKDFLRKTLTLREKDRLQWDQVFDHPIFHGYFDQYRNQNKQIEDKLKVFMSGLRFKINSENIDIRKMFQILGFKQQTELNFEEFHKFLFYINPQITESEIRFFFDKVDANESGTISIDQIQKEMSKHNIIVSKLRKTNTLNNEQEQHKQLNKQLSGQLAQKAKKCFQKLFRVLSYKKISLKKTFQAYDKQGHGNLTFQSFNGMIKRLDSNFTQEDILMIFNQIDNDHSKTIQFQELNAYYCKVNGLPEGFDHRDAPYHTPRK